MLVPRAIGLRRPLIAPGWDGTIQIPHRVLAKAPRPEVAEQFLSSAPPSPLRRLVENRKLTRAEAEIAQFILMADDICVEADSGGHRNRGVLLSCFGTPIRFNPKITSPRENYRY